MFLREAAKTTDGQLLASWMADIFFAPVSIINPPPAPAKTTSHVDLTSPTPSPLRRANSVFSASGSPETPMRTPQAQVSPVRPRSAATAQTPTRNAHPPVNAAHPPAASATVPKPAQSAAPKARVGTVLPGFPESYVQFKSTSTGKTWTLVAGTVTRFGIVLPNGTVRPNAAGKKQGTPVGVPVNKPVAAANAHKPNAAISNAATPAVPAPATRASSSAPSKPASSKASVQGAPKAASSLKSTAIPVVGTVLPGYPNTVVRCRPAGPSGPEMVLRAGTVTRIGVVMADGSIRAQAGTPVQSTPASASKTPTFAKARAPVAPAGHPKPVATATPAAAVKTAAATPAGARMAQSKPAVKASTKPIVKAPTPRDPSTALILRTPCLATTKLKVRLEFMKGSGKDPSAPRPRPINVSTRFLESSIEKVARNLSKQTPLTTSWPTDMLPSEGSFATSEAAISYAMVHAYTRHYQLVIRFQDGVTFLNCNRMCQDDIDRAYDSNVEWSNRQSCNFALRVQRDAASDRWILSHVPGRSEHNHAPSINPHGLQENGWFGRGLANPRFDDPKGKLDELERHGLSLDEIIEAAKVMFPFETHTKPKVSKTLKEIQAARLEGGTPHQALYKLFSEAPFLRAKCRVSNHDAPDTIFFAHTHGYQLWRAYPEVVLFDDLEGRMVNGKYHRIVMIKGVDCHDEPFPIAACIVEKKSAREAIDAPCWRWIFKELKEMFTDYKIPDPEFFQSSCQLDAMKACEKVFPCSHVYMDPEASEKLENDTVRRYFKSQSYIRDALSSWSNVVYAEDEYMMERTMSKIKNCRLCPKSEKKFLTEMKKYMSRINLGIKNEHMHFGVFQNSEYEVIVREKPANVFEMVRCLLHTFVDEYDARQMESCREHVSRMHGLSNLLDDCVHIISCEALGRVQKMIDSFPKLHEGASCYCEDRHSRGHPCVHELRTILNQRKLSPDDFHPHWRNLCADLAEIPVSGLGRHTKKWAALKTGKEVYSHGFTETFKKPRVVKPKAAGKENQPPKKKQKVA